jgi:hypothetical protein
VTESADDIETGKSEEMTNQRKQSLTETVKKGVGRRLKRFGKGAKTWMAETWKAINLPGNRMVASIGIFLTIFLSVQAGPIGLVLAAVLTVLMWLMKTAISRSMVPDRTLGPPLFAEGGIRGRVNKERIRSIIGQSPITFLIQLSPTIKELELLPDRVITNLLLNNNHRIRRTSKLPIASLIPHQLQLI